MRRRESAVVVAGLVLAGLGVTPLAAQPTAPPGQIQAVTNVPALVFDAETKQYDASPGEQDAPFTFNLTNVWTNEIVIDKVRADCHCTTASLPSDPWHIPPQGSGQIRAKVNLSGKTGLIAKTLTLYTSAGNRVLNMKVNIPLPPAAAVVMTGEEREAAVLKAAADRQALFKGECAKCHADKGRNAFGENLYAADCGICHESSSRKSFVPDLHAMKQATDLDYWKTIITFGKPNTMMPAFATAQGGPLTDAQVTSLATYLNHTISHNFSPAATNTASAPLNPPATSP